MSTIRGLGAALLFTALTVIAATPAVAVTSTTVVITDDGQPVPRSSVRIVDTTTGAEIPPEGGRDDGCGTVVQLSAGSYRVEVDGTAVEEFTVTGEGNEQVAVDIGGGPAPETCGPEKTKAPRPDRGGRD